MRHLLRLGWTLVVLIPTAMMAQPKLQGDGWEVVYRAGRGTELRLAGVLLGRGSWLQFAAPDWKRGYFSSSHLAPQVETDTDRIRLTHALNPTYGKAIETLRRVDPQTLEWSLEVHWESDLPAIVEWSVGIWNVSLLYGAQLQADTPLPYTRIQPEAPTLPGDCLMEGRELTVNARFGTLRIQAVDATPLGVLDGRASRRAWSQEFPAYWFGVLSAPVPKGQTMLIRYRFTLQPKPLPTEHPRLTLNARPIAIDDFAAPTPQTPILLPPPKIVWDAPNSEPLRLPADRTVLIALESDAYRPVGEVILRALQRYGVRGELRVDPDGDAPIRILGEPSRQRQYPVPDLPGAYYLQVEPSGVHIVGRGVEGALYGAHTLAQLLQPTENALLIQPTRIVDYPSLQWRGVHLFGSTQSGFLDRLIQNVIAPAKFNHLVIECGYAQWETIRPAWVDISAPKPILQQAVQTARANLLEPIPLIQSLGHMYWVFRNDANLELAEDPETPWAISPRRPQTRPFLQRLYDEVFQLFEPRHFHIGLDEVALRGRFPYRPESQGAAKAELFTEHAEWLHQELKRRGVEQILMWGDALLAPGEANDGGAQATSQAEAQFVREQLSPLPDLVICDWHYTPAKPEDYISLRVLQNAGFKHLIATTWYNPDNIYTFARGAQLRRIRGLLQSTWAGYSLNENTLRGQEFRQFIAYLLAGLYAWDTNAPPPDQLNLDVEALFHDWYRREPIPLQARPGFTVALSLLANHPLSQLHPMFQDLPVGAVRLGGYRYTVAGTQGEPRAVMFAGYLVPDAPERYPTELVIPLERTVRTLHLLATTAHPVEFNAEVATLTAEYTDGTQAQLSLRYGIHLRAWNDSGHAFEGQPVWSRNTGSFWTRLRQIRWQNPHPDKTLRQVRIQASDRTASLLLVGLSGE